MKTTLKRGVGRGAEVNGNGHSVFPPGPVSAVARYHSPPPPARSGLVLLRRILVGTVVAVLALAFGVAGGAYLWWHESLDAVRAHSKDVVETEKRLNVQLPGEPAVALVLGYDKRAGETGNESRSDTIMLLRADPQTKTISMFSFPRDLNVPIWCGQREYGIGKINSAYSNCDNGPLGTLVTVQKLTGIHIHYLITVNFRGFREIVDEFGGIWLDIDRRYYNRNTDSEYNNYANINLLPGYQRLAGGAALDFVRFRHTDSDFHRLARQQQFVRAFKQQIAQNLNPLDVPKIVSTITENVEVGGNPPGKKVLEYAWLAATLPAGHFLQTRIDTSKIYGINDLEVSDDVIKAAVSEFTNPDVGVAEVANATALGTKLRRKTPLPKDTTVTVLNGNGVPGAAAEASYLLGQRGYVTTPPRGGAQADAPTQNYFHTVIYFNPKARGARAAGRALGRLLAPADIRPLPTAGRLRALHPPGSMLLVALGSTFHNALTSPTAPPPPTRQPPAVRYGDTSARPLLAPLQRRVAFPLQVPTVVAENSYLDEYNGDKPMHFYRIEKGHKAVRLVFRLGANEYWGIQQTDWEDAPVLGDRSFRRTIGGRSFDLYYSGSHLHMAVLHANGASYWVINTLLDTLSNETMIAIAKGLKPLTAAK
jgi:LCP family protein required for cell wall assembly